jgi:hypothetical protein
LIDFTKDAKMSFLDFDAVYLLTVLVSGVPHLKPEQRFGELDRNLVLISTIVHIVQIIVGFDVSVFSVSFMKKSNVKKLHLSSRWMKLPLK